MNSIDYASPAHSAYEEVQLGAPKNKLSRIEQLAQTLFGIQQDVFEPLKNMTYLPHEGKCPKLFYLQAVYLATVIANDAKSPLSKEDTESALRARMGKEQAKAWLNNGLVCGTVTITISAIAALALSIPTTTVAVGTIALNAVNLVANPITNAVNWASTGYFPDVSSRADDIKARAALEAQSTYDNVALSILRKYKNPKYATEMKEFVSLFPLDVIVTKLQNDYDLDGYADDILRNIRGVFRWIDKGEIDSKSRIYEWVKLPRLKHVSQTTHST